MVSRVGPQGCGVRGTRRRQAPPAYWDSQATLYPSCLPRRPSVLQLPLSSPSASDSSASAQLHSRSLNLVLHDPTSTPSSRPSASFPAMATGVINGVRSMCMSPKPPLIAESDASSLPAALDDPSKETKVVASDGRSGEQKDIVYTNCKVIGNGSFGIVFQAKMLGVPKRLEDIAIKKVLQTNVSRFVIDSFPPSLTLTPAYLSLSQNRELQIMRLVSIPTSSTCVRFFYSNGEKVSKYSCSVPDFSKRSI